MAKKQEVASVERLAAEGGIASDESAAEELVIEANEGPVDEPGNEPDENFAWEGEYCEAGCSIEMDYSYSLKVMRSCGRELHVAPDGIDEKPACLMHSKDPNKQSGPLFDAFWSEFERILKDAGEGEAHFEHFVFPELDFSERTFLAGCRFDFATFTQDADFGKAIFENVPSFYEATFEEGAGFDEATFTKGALFSGSTFTQDADFYEAIFVETATFSEATFAQSADFFETTFRQFADFSDASFAQDADFVQATFARDADFAGVTFTKTAIFRNTKFYGASNWRESRFFDQAEFRGTEFRLRVKGRPSAVFALAKFTKPGEIVFDEVDLSRALFHNCDVSQVWFTSSVQWAKRENNHGLAVFDETIPLKQEYGRELRGDRQRDYRAVAQIYQQLKKNYDSRLDYWTANEFHFGEMEMKRLAMPTSGPLLWLRRWWHRNLSFVAWYRRASDYGNSYRKPLLWLLGTLAAAALLFPIPGIGLKPPISGDAASAASVTYSRVWNRQESWTNNFWTEAKLIGKSGITAIDTATFQRTPEYTPVYPQGRVVAILETLLTSSLFALFLLAIRRQFRR
jgi:hypothetical protein